MVGIYKIENLQNHKVYIGQSINIERRWTTHKHDAFDESGIAYNYPIYRAIRKYGLDNFSFEVIEECHREELDSKEREYIEKYNSFFNGYNQNFGGQNGNLNPLINSKEHIIGIIKDLEEGKLTQGEISEKWDVNISTVNGINTGRVWNHNRKYPIQDNYNNRKKIQKCCDCGKEISKGAKRCLSCESIRRNDKKKPSREELKEKIRTTSFVAIGKQYNVSDNAIRKWCLSMNLPSRVKEIKSYSDEEWELI